jgi:peroxin-1
VFSVSHPPTTALHPNLRYQLSTRPFQDCISVQLLSKEHIEKEIHKLRDLAEKKEVQIRIVPLSLTTTPNKDTIGMKHKSWRMPNDFRSSCFVEGHIRQDLSVNTAQSFLEMWRRMYLFSDTVFDGDAILTNGSIVSLPCGPDFASDFHYKILIEESNAKNKSLKTFLILAGQLASLSPLLDGDKVSTKSKHLDDYMLNILPGTRIPTGNPVLNTAWQSKIDTIRVERKGESSCLAIIGETGCGKTHLCLSISAYLRKASHHCVYLDCKQLKSSQLSLSDMLTELSSAFYEARRCQPSLIILDDLDQLVPNVGVTNQRNNGSARQESQIDQILLNQIQVMSDHLLFLIRSQKQISAASSGPLFLCSCRTNKSLPADLRSADCFACSIKCPSLSDVQRVEIFFSSMESLPSLGMKGSEEEHDVKYTLENIFNGTDSYRPKDMNILGMRFHAIWAGTRDAHEVKSPSEVLETLLSTFTPLSLRSLNIPPQKKNILEWKEIGGLFRAKTCLSDAILRPIKYNAVYKNVPITLPKGVLLFGPPGCGKSCLVPALAQACNFNVVTCHGPELLDKYIGASEAKVRQLFDNAYAAAPSILFFDDIDALAPKRGTDATGVTDRVVNQLLTFLDGVEMPENDSSTVYIIAASSRPDKIDPALLRPGRLERHFYIGFSENDKEFNDLLTKISLVRSVEEDTQIMIQDGTFLEKLTEAGIPYEKLTGADIKGIFDAAHIRAVHSLLQEERNTDMATATEKDFRGHVSINEENLFRAFSSARPSISTSDLNTLSDSYLPFLGKEATSALKRYDDKRPENPWATALKTMLK